jgi:predicted negative regulator of RcsB-dependent stress response
MAEKKKSDKDLKEPDKLQIMFMQGIEFFNEHRQKFYIGAGVAAFLILAAGGWYLYRMDVEKSADALYMKANLSAQTGTIQDVLNQYRDLVKKYPDSRSGLAAQYRLANIMYNMNDIDGAIAAYQGYLKEASGDDDLTTLVYTGLGYCYESKGDLKTALSFFEKAEKSKAGINFESMNYRNLGRIYEAMNDRAKALEYYQKALGKTTDPMVERFIKRKIASLG